MSAARLAVRKDRRDSGRNLINIMEINVFMMYDVLQSMLIQRCNQ